jgi:cyclopropane-fatty-acyl-phospholipid synthase
MSYSSAMFSGPDPTLEDAQTAKQRRVIELTEAKRG